jgi:hypothetical protein
VAVGRARVAEQEEVVVAAKAVGKAAAEEAVEMVEARRQPWIHTEKSRRSQWCIAQRT